MDAKTIINLVFEVRAFDHNIGGVVGFETSPEGDIAVELDNGTLTISESLYVQYNDDMSNIDPTRYQAVAHTFVETI